MSNSEAKVPDENTKKAEEKKAEETKADKKKDSSADDKKLQEAKELAKKISDRYTKSTKESKESIDADVQKDIDKIKKLLDEHSPKIKLPDFKLGPGEVDKFIKYLDSGIKASDSSKPKDETLTVFIHKSRILEGFLLRDLGRVEHKKVNPVAIANDDNVDLYLKNPSEENLEVEDAFYQNKESFETASNLAEEGCESWAKSFNVGIGGQLHGIIGGFSLSGARSKAVQMDQGRATAEKESTCEWYQVRNTISRKKDIEIPKEHLILTKDTISALEDIAKLTGQDDLLQIALDKFFDKFGSHVLSYVTLGGKYKFVAYTKADAKAGTDLIQAAVSTRLQEEMHAGFSASLPGVISAEVGGGESRGKQDTKAWQDKAEFANIVSSTIVSKKVVGGVEGNQDEWLKSLNSNSNWVVVDRDINYATPIWEIVERSQNELPNTNLSTLMIIMRNYWVRNYLKSLKIINYEQLEVLLKEDAENREIIARAKDAFENEIVNHNWIPSDVRNAHKKLQELLDSKKEVKDPILEIINQRNNGLRILGATYSDANVTPHVREKINIQTSEVDIGASPEEFGFDPHPEDSKFVYIVYQYGTYKPCTLTLYSGTSKVITKQSSNQPWNQQFQNGQLIILGAAYGCKDVTEDVRRLVKDNELNFQPNSLEDNLVNVRKFAMVVYQYWPDEPQVIAGREGDHIVVKKK